MYKLTSRKLEVKYFIVQCDSQVKMSVVYPVIKTGGRDDTDSEG